MGRLVFVLSLVLGLGVSAVPVRAQGPCWEPPVLGVVTDPFRAPPCPWCAGNRGIEYGIGRHTVVRAAATGTVVFAGPVAGVTYVVVELANGWRLTYGRLTATTLTTGDAVVARSQIGAASRNFYFGLRVGETYTDPGPFLGTFVGRPRLIPIDGTPARPAPAPTLRCAASTAHRVPTRTASRPM